MSAVVGNIEDLTELAAEVVEAGAGIASAISSFKAIDTAQNYYNLYKQQRDFYYTTFQNGGEALMAAEIGAEAPYQVDYAGRMADLANVSTGPLGATLADTQGWITRHAGMYAQTPDTKITESAEALARLKSDWANYLFRYEELWADLREDDRWAKRLTLHNIAIKQGTAVAASMADGLENYQNALGAFGSQLATFANGAAQFIGYRRGLNDAGTAFEGLGPATQQIDDPVQYLYGN